MSYEMKLLRKEDLSLYYYIKDSVLKDFIETEELAPLYLLKDYNCTNSYVYECLLNFTPSPSDKGRGFVYFDSPNGGTSCEPFPSFSGTNGDGDVAYGTTEQSDNVILYETTSSGLDVVPWEDYMIDYVDCRIISKRKLDDPKLTFKWNYISVVDEWPSSKAVDTPIVVIDINPGIKEGYQLGGGKKVSRDVSIFIFGSNSAERNDIVETLYDGLYLRSCPLYDFPTGSVLDFDGTFYGRRDLINETNKLTFLFDRSKVNDVSSLKFDNIKSTHMNSRSTIIKSNDELNLSDLNLYRSKVSFTMFSYDDRNLS